MIMKLIVRSRIFIVLGGTFLLLTNVVFPGVGAPVQEKEKTVEQVKKNIQVLKGLPASQLTLVMNYMASSLGVQCNHCHVIDQTGWYMDKDDKQTKLTARKMMQMVMDINTKNFSGRNEVTCYTCHRGSTDPASMISLPPSPPKPRGEEASEGPVLPTGEQVLAMCEKAIGGSGAMKKVTTRVTKGIMIGGQGREMPVELVQQAPDKFVSSMTMKDGAQSMRAFNGKNGWMSSPRGSREMSPEESDELKQDGLLFPITRLRELSKTVTVSGKDTVNGVMAYVLSFPAGEHREERYFIDTATGLLLRKAVVTTTMIGDIPDQIDYSDYRDVDGVKVPFTVRVASVDPRDASTTKYSSVQQNVSIDEKKFVMPQGKK